MFVAFLGADGSGKSSVITRIVPALAPAFQHAEVFHLRPDLGRQKEHAGPPVVEPHGKPNRGALLSLAKLLYFLCDYTLGYLFIVRPRLVRSALVIFDRYYYDLLVDPKRYRYGASMWLARLVGRLIPSPDLVILLDAPAQVLQSRKQEVSFAETARQREAYLALVYAMQNGVVIDVSQPLDGVVAAVSGTILEFLSQKTATRSEGSCRS